MAVPLNLWLPGLQVCMHEGPLKPTVFIPWNYVAVKHKAWHAGLREVPLLVLWLYSSNICWGCQHDWHPDAQHACLFKTSEKLSDTRISWWLECDKIFMHQLSKWLGIHSCNKETELEHSVHCPTKVTSHPLTTAADILSLVLLNWLQQTIPLMP